MALPSPVRGLLAVSAACLALLACAEEPPAPPAPPAASAGAEPAAPGKKLLKQGEIVFGEVWDGPEVKRYSQANEELIIRDFFQDRREGFFLDVGASLPIVGSTTFYLEKHLGWSGIAIDALAEYAPKYQKARPRSRFFAYIVTDHSGKQEKFYRVQGAPALSSTTEREWAGVKLGSEVIEVPTITLDELLEREGVERIDFLSMDIEGGEPKALAGFDIERYRPELVCIEAKGMEDFFERYFADHGYERIDEYMKYDYVNWYYTPAKGDGGQGGA